MKRLLLGMTAALALGGLSAEAYNGCDSCCDRFQGLYIGANVGWAFHDSTWVDRDAWVDNFTTDWAIGSVVGVRDGVTVGGQIGYNVQCGCALYGLEVDGNWARLRDTKQFSPNEEGDTILTLRHEMEWFGTIRGRAGIVADNLLLYATAGTVFANLRNDWSIVDVNDDPESFSSNDTRWGLAIGFGTEWAFCRLFTLKAEALYFKFPERTRTFFSPVADTGVTFDLIDDAWVARVGVNFGLANFFCCR